VGAIRFAPLRYVYRPGGDGSLDDAPHNTDLVAALRAHYPELGAWSSKQLEDAWISYGDEVQGGWTGRLLDPAPAAVASRDHCFLAYLFAVQELIAVGLYERADGSRYGMFDLDDLDALWRKRDALARCHR